MSFISGCLWRLGLLWPNHIQNQLESLLHVFIILCVILLSKTVCCYLKSLYMYVPKVSKHGPLYPLHFSSVWFPWMSHFLSKIKGDTKYAVQFLMLCSTLTGHVLYILYELFLYCFFLGFSFWWSVAEDSGFPIISQLYLSDLAIFNLVDPQYCSQS